MRIHEDHAYEVPWCGSGRLDVVAIARRGQALVDSRVRQGVDRASHDLPCERVDWLSFEFRVESLEVDG